MNEEPKVNDGNGLFDVFGMIDLLIIDCNELPKDLVAGNYIRFSGRLVDMVNKLSVMRDGLKKEQEARKDGRGTEIDPEGRYDY